MVFNTVNRKGKAVLTSEEQSILDYIIHPLDRQFFMGTYVVQQFAAKDSHVFFSPNVHARDKILCININGHS